MEASGTALLGIGAGAALRVDDVGGGAALGNVTLADGTLEAGAGSIDAQGGPADQRHPHRGRRFSPSTATAS